jgi:hypothetical protein
MTTGQFCLLWPPLPLSAERCSTLQPAKKTKSDEAVVAIASRDVIEPALLVPEKRISDLPPD